MNYRLNFCSFWGLRTFVSPAYNFETELGYEFYYLINGTVHVIFCLRFMQVVMQMEMENGDGDGDEEAKVCIVFYISPQTHQCHSDFLDTAFVCQFCPIFSEFLCLTHRQRVFRNI